MQTNFQRSGINAAHSRSSKKALTVIWPFMRIRKAAYNSFDDFLDKVPIGTLNEHGQRVICGKRIC